MWGRLKAMNLYVYGAKGRRKIDLWYINKDVYKKRHKDWGNAHFFLDPWICLVKRQLALSTCRYRNLGNGYSKVDNI